ncbi:putative elongation of fatty acids protein 1 [Smittium mucronatum]|uniref:Elongation of fatty acids protein n=1 Tax=Smittium mucronatum TaxID=133383 RepID=A0A1R0H9B3_9FUNG|nr:putative elongation of fatty acids protein 1 [Smittium mucronatum]
MYLDSILQACMAAVGKDKDSWRYTSGSTVASTWSFVLTGTMIYLILVFGGKAVMKNFKPLELNAYTQFHNIYLSVISGLLLALFFEQLLPNLSQHGLFWSICDRDAWTQKLELLYYINYMIKWIEFIDTFLLVLKKKKTPFLHVYHHSMTMILCFTQLEGTTSVSWVPVTINLLVHVIMYYYYYLTAIGVRVWWKKLVTAVQIIQFVIDLGFVYFCSYNVFVDNYKVNLPYVGSCRGSEFAAIFGCLLLSSYLLLFVNFFVNTYKRSVNAVRGKKNN